MDGRQPVGLCIGILRKANGLLVAGAQVGGQDDDGVSEIGHPAEIVEEDALVEHGHQGVEYSGVGLFDLIEQHHGEGALPGSGGSTVRVRGPNR